MKATFSEDDITALLRIAAEVGELSVDSRIRRAHLLGRMLELVGGAHAVLSEVDRPAPGCFAARPGSIVHAGLVSPSETAAVDRYLCSGVPADPCIPFLFGGPGPTVALRREDVIDRSWFRSEHYNRLRRPLALGDSLYWKFFTPDGRCFRAGIQRERNDMAFTERDVRLIKIFHANLSAAYMAPRAPTSSEELEDSRLPELPSRPRLVLRHLLNGQSEKQIALALGLSQHTVHDYVKFLHHKLGVSSRAELLSRFISSN